MKALSNHISVRPHQNKRVVILSIKPGKISTVILMASIVLHSCAQAASATDGWVVSMKGETLPGFLNYARSELYPVVKVSVTEQNLPAAAPASNYEDLYFSSAHAIGCWRYETLQAQPGTMGIISVLNPQADSSQGHAIAGSIARVFLDLYTRKCILRAVIIPTASFSQVQTSLLNYGFQVVSSFNPPESNHPLFTIELDSDPPGTTQTMSYCAQ